jgi:pyruvate/2-oxoglutarate dehydrogenase complex dihydrolipoamide acyltransferase (E2) component
MSAREVVIPKLGMDTVDCEVKAWLVRVGDRVTPGAALLEVETEKTEVVIEAECTGTVRELRAQVGERVAVGAVVAVIEG